MVYKERMWRSTIRYLMRRNSGAPAALHQLNLQWDKCYSELELHACRGATLAWLHPGMWTYSNILELIDSDSVHSSLHADFSSSRRKNSGFESTLREFMFIIRAVPEVQNASWCPELPSNQVSIQEVEALTCRQRSKCLCVADAVFPRFALNAARREPN